MQEADLEKLFLEPKRLAILCELTKMPESMDFSSLKKACDLTDGNLNSHLKKLSEAGIVRISKKFIDNKPRTLISLSSFGRSSFFEYIKQLESIVQNAVRRIDRIEAQERPARSSTRKTAPQRG